ncbi:DNA recombination protein RmuC [Oceaniglobus indicus]|uniref:DNA recombination protein RmuC n=1 Tax=Oceaniglobus indicus TaxID=2047749 RepID=UPI0013041255|nr:DNA recombination protein RmuC [Oceaniglobus indicus]
METLLSNPEQLILPVLVIIGLAVLVLLFRKPPAVQKDPELADAVSRAQADVQRLEKTLADTCDERDSLRHSLSREQVQSARLETDRDTLKARIEALKSEHDQTLDAVERRGRDSIAKLDEALSAERKAAERLRDEKSALQTENRVLSQTLETQRIKHEELKAEIEANRTHFVNQFKTISSELLQNQGRATTEVQKAELEKLLTPFKQELGFLKTGIKDMSEKADKERQSLGQQIQLMQAKASELSAEANSLTLALRGDRKRQGNWGETILERILESAGLVEGTHFTKQATTTDEHGKRLIPDVVVHLPGQRDVIIDSKVTLVAYQDMVQAGQDRDREEAALKRHILAMKAHMQSLSKKSYDGIGYDSVDSVMMFLPVEGALSAALSREPDLVLEAAEKRIHIMTPSTLMPILKIVDHLWTIDSRNRNVDEIVDRAGRLHDKFASVVESIDDIGKHLRKASDSQAEAIRRMSSGTGNVLRQVDQLRVMGAKSKKNIPEHLLANADDEVAEPAG